MRHAMAICAATLFFAAAHASPHPVTPRVERVAGLSADEFQKALRREMPLPVIRVLHGRQSGTDWFVIEMSTAGLAGATVPAVHVSFHAGDGEFLEALHAAGRAIKAKLQHLIPTE